MRRRTQPNQIIIKKYIQVPTARKRIRKIARKSVNGKPVVRPLIIKKIETPSIVIETPNSTKLRKSLNFKKLNYLDDADDGLLEDEDLLNYVNGLPYGGNSLGSRYDLGSSYKFGNLDKFSNYGLVNSYDASNGFKSSLLNSYEPINALNGHPSGIASNRELYLKKNKIDMSDPPEDGQSNERNRDRSRSAMGNSMQEQNYLQRNFKASTNNGNAVNNDGGGRSFLNDYKRAEDRPFGKHEDQGRSRYADKYADKYEYQESFSPSNRNSSKSGNYAKQSVRWFEIQTLNSIFLVSNRGSLN